MSVKNYKKKSDGTLELRYEVLTKTESNTNYQPKDSKLTSISGLSGSSTGFVKLTNGVASLETPSSSGGGTVTSVAVSNATNGGLSVSGSPVTSSGTITIGLASGYGDTKNPYASKTKNYVLAAPNGSAGVPSFRALASADIPSLAASKITSGTFDAARIPSLAASKITSGTFADARIASAATWNSKLGPNVWLMWSGDTTYGSGTMSTGWYWLGNSGNANPNNGGFRYLLFECWYAVSNGDEHFFVLVDTSIYMNGSKIYLNGCNAGSNHYMVLQRVDDYTINVVEFSNLLGFGCWGIW